MNPFARPLLRGDTPTLPNVPLAAPSIPLPSEAELAAMREAFARVAEAITHLGETFQTLAATSAKAALNLHVLLADLDEAGL